MENEAVLITKEVIENAKTYVPIESKYKYVSEIAPLCFDRVEIHTSTGSLLPPMYKESHCLKSRYLMTAFVKMYLNMECETEDEGGFLMNTAEYDRFSGSHVFSQINALKFADVKTKEKCFHMQNDYKDLCIKFDSEIHGLMKAMNDPVNRVMELLKASLTPEAMEETMKQLDDIKDKMTMMQKETE